MSEMLKTNTTLTSLNLECDEKGRKIKRNREMKNDLQIMLLEMKEQNQWLKCWRQTKHWHHLTWNVRKKGKWERERNDKLFAGNWIRDEGAKSMSKMLKMITTLKSLNRASEEEKEKEKWQKWWMIDRQYDWRWRSHIDEWNADDKHHVDITQSGRWGRKGKKWEI